MPMNSSGKFLLILSWLGMMRESRGLHFALMFAMALGLIVQISGKVWFLSGSGRNAQIYIWLLLPALLVFFSKILRLRINVQLEYVPWLLFLVWVGLSTSWSDQPTENYHLIKRPLLVALYLFAILILLRQGESYFRFSLLSGFFLVAIGAGLSLFYQYYYLDRPMSYRAFRIDRMGLGDIANFGWPVAAGIFHGAIATWLLGVGLSKDVSKKLLISSLMAFLILSFYVLMTGSRGAWVALGCSSFIVLLVQRRELVRPAVYTGFVFFVLCAFLFWRQIVAGVQSYPLSGRGEIWQYFFEVMNGHWLLGFGLGTPFEFVWSNHVKVSPHAHSLYLQQIYDSGLISLVLMFSALAGLLKKSWGLRTNPWVRLSIPALFFALIAMLTDVERIVTRPGDYWTVFWLPIAILLAVNSRGATHPI